MWLKKVRNDVLASEDGDISYIESLELQLVKQLDVFKVDYLVSFDEWVAMIEHDKKDHITVDFS